MAPENVGSSHSSLIKNNNNNNNKCGPEKNLRTLNFFPFIQRAQMALEIFGLFQPLSMCDVSFGVKTH